MNFGELTKDFREETGDKASPFLWSDCEIGSHINAAYTEAVDRGLVIYDRESFAVDVEPGVIRYQLDTAIIRVKAACITRKDGVDLDEPEVLRLGNRRYDFALCEFSDPQGFMVDEDGLFILAASPTVAATIALEVYRYPAPLKNAGDKPKIPEIYHRKLLAWALKLAYLKNDADAFDQQRSDRYDAEFTRTFGPAKTAQQHRQRRRNAARSTKTPGY